MKEKKKRVRAKSATGSVPGGITGGTLLIRGMLLIYHQHTTYIVWKMSATVGAGFITKAWHEPLIHLDAAVRPCHIHNWYVQWGSRGCVGWLEPRLRGLGNHERCQSTRPPPPAPLVPAPASASRNGWVFVYHFQRCQVPWTPLVHLHRYIEVGREELGWRAACSWGSWGLGGGAGGRAQWWWMMSSLQCCTSVNVWLV